MSRAPDQHHEGVSGRPTIPLVCANLWDVQDVALLDGRLFVLNPVIANPVEAPMALEVVDDTTLKMVSGPGGGSIGESMRYDFAPDGSIRSVRGGSGMTLHPFSPPV